MWGFRANSMWGFRANSMWVFRANTVFRVKMYAYGSNEVFNKINTSVIYSHTSLCVLLAVHIGIILADNQHDAQFFFLIRLFQFSTCFEQHRAHHQEN
jgi:hypothetical protein